MRLNVSLAENCFPISLCVPSLHLFPTAGAAFCIKSIVVRLNHHSLSLTKSLAIGKSDTCHPTLTGTTLLIWNAIATLHEDHNCSAATEYEASLFRSVPLIDPIIPLPSLMEAALILGIVCTAFSALTVTFQCHVVHGWSWAAGPKAILHWTKPQFHSLPVPNLIPPGEALHWIDSDLQGRGLFG